jgi:hypothetical protein
MNVFRFLGFQEMLTGQSPAYPRGGQSPAGQSPVTPQSPLRGAGKGGGYKGGDKIKTLGTRGEIIDKTFSLSSR